MRLVSMQSDVSCRVITYLWEPKVAEQTSKPEPTLP